MVYAPQTHAIQENNEVYIKWMLKLFIPLTLNPSVLETNRVVGCLTVGKGLKLIAIQSFGYIRINGNFMVFKHKYMGKEFSALESIRMILKILKMSSSIK